MKDFKVPAREEEINKVVDALKANNFNVEVVSSKEEAKEKVISMIPVGSEVMTMVSQTLEETGIAEELNNSGKYEANRIKMNAKDTSEEEKMKLGYTPEYALGSVHAITHDGKVLMASNSGSQMPAYIYGAKNVIWIVGAQKIVENLDEGIKRIYEHSYPLENERAQKAYGVNSNVSKILIINNEKKPGRTTIVLIKDAIGF